MRAGVDTGGTFTDVVTSDGRGVKVPSTTADPSVAVADGLRAVTGSPAGGSPGGSRAGEAGAAGLREVAHGTTVATNALLERRGGVVGLITTEGHADVIEIARQVRPSLYDQWADRAEPLVPRHRRWEHRGRLAADGWELVCSGELTPAVMAAATACDSVAVCLLHADRYPAHEQAVAASLRAAGVDVVCSAEVSPEFREYERTVTTVADAYLRKPCRAYLLALRDVAPEVLVMTSAGGLVPLGQAAEHPVSLLLSGPAGGVLAAAAAAAAAGYPDAVSFDMGGTSTDVCLVRGGSPEPAAQRSVGGLPIRMPALDIHTIGAGGGSIARIDAGGALVVGPQSAGAEPGPACYGRGGRQATVTDADLVAGRLPAGLPLPGIGALDGRAAAAALDRAGTPAAGVLAVVDAAMTQAVRRVSVEQGVEPRRLALVAFGGAGPLHACALADQLAMPAVVVPPLAGVLSAVGMLRASRQVDLVRSWVGPVDDGIETALRELGAAALARLGSEGNRAELLRSVDCRYAGQSHEISVPTVADFGAEHRRRNGFERPGWPIEVVALRATARLPPPEDPQPCPAAATGRRGTVRGPAIIAEADCTIWVADGWRATAHPAGSWLMTRVGAP